MFILQNWIRDGGQAGTGGWHTRSRHKTGSAAWERGVSEARGERRLGVVPTGWRVVGPDGRQWEPVLDLVPQ